MPKPIQKATVARTILMVEFSFLKCSITALFIESVDPLVYISAILSVRKYNNETLPVGSGYRYMPAPIIETLRFYKRVTCNLKPTAGRHHAFLSLAY